MAINKSNICSAMILTPNTSDVPMVPLKSFLDYLKRLCGSILISSLESMVDMEPSFSKPTSLTSIQEFIENSGCRTLFISRLTANREPSSTTLSVTTPFVHQSTELSSSSSDVFEMSIKMPSADSNILLIIIKRVPLFQSDQSFRDQVLIVTMFNSNPWETLHGYVSHVMRPYLEMYVPGLHPKESKHVGVHLSLKKKLQDIETDLVMVKNVDMDDVESSHDNCNDDIDYDMVLFELTFTNVLNDNSRAHVFDALFAYSSLSAAAARRENRDIQIRQITNAIHSFQPNETFSISFECQISFFICQGYLRRRFNQCGHIMTLSKPPYLAQDIVV